MRKLAIIHFNPVEIYPPVLNWLNYLSAHPDPPIEVRVYTMAPPQAISPFVPASANIRIVRAGHPGRKRALTRYWQYMLFYLRALLGLLFWRPGSVLYYETISSLPALLYKRYFNRKTRLLIHYHEYTTASEYTHGMVLSKYLHRIEKKMYQEAEWLSHTHEDRVAFFIEDMRQIRLPSVRILPNFPPVSWKTPLRAARAAGEPLRIVHVGALSLDTMYTREFVDWVIRQSGEVILDVFTNNASKEALDLVQTADDRFIRFRGAVDYLSLPEVLRCYHVGVSLYKGSIPNHVYSAPNKLFEYLACGLDVWFPHTLLGSHPYITRGTFPQVISLDFTALSAFDWRKATTRDGLTLHEPHWYCEMVLGDLYRQIISN